MANTVIKTRYEQRSEVNKSYQTPSRVQTYVATQDYVVPKLVFFEKIIDILTNEFSSNQKNLNIFEPGTGPASFTPFVLNNNFVNKFKQLNLDCADISHSMIDYSHEIISKIIGSSNADVEINIKLASGVNCVNPKETYYQKILDSGIKYQAIIASQFEHYCPNDHNSNLATKYKDAGISYVTKSEFRHFCYNLLADDGIYFTIDDRLGESEEEQKQICYSWDRHVVKQFTDEKILSNLEKKSSPLVRNLRISYDAKRPEDALIQVASKAREHRRNICNEEIERLSSTAKNFNELYGESNVNYIMHPSIETHPGFYLMWAKKQ